MSVLNINSIISEDITKKIIFLLYQLKMKNKYWEDYKC